MINRAIFALSLLGLGISVFLQYEYSLEGSIVCPLGGGCDIVRTSSYSHILGISLPILGIIFYLGIALSSVFRWTTAQLLSALVGFIFGVYLTFLEAFVIGAFCFWCVLSFIISGAIFVLAILSWSKIKHENRN